MAKKLEHENLDIDYTDYFPDAPDMPSVSTASDIADAYGEGSPNDRGGGRYYYAPDVDAAIASFRRVVEDKLHELLHEATRQHDSFVSEINEMVDELKKDLKDAQDSYDGCLTDLKEKHDECCRHERMILWSRRIIGAYSSAGIYYYPVCGDSTPAWGDPGSENYIDTTPIMISHETIEFIPDVNLANESIDISEGLIQSAIIQILLDEICDHRHQKLHDVYDERMAMTDYVLMADRNVDLMSRGGYNRAMAMVNHSKQLHKDEMTHRILKLGDTQRETLRYTYFSKMGLI